MVRKSMGPRRRSRNIKSKRKLTINDWMKEMEVGQRVHIDIKPSVHPVPHRRYRGKTGTIVEKRGDAYIVEVMIGKKMKKLILKAPHLVPAKVV